MSRNKTVIRQAVRGIYDIQDLRIAIGNRICMAFRSKIPESKQKEVDDVLKVVKLSYRRLTDGLVGLPSVRQFEGMDKAGSIIDDIVELDLVHSYMRILADEEDAFKRLERDLQAYPIYTDWIKPHVRGMGPAMAGVLISEIDIEKAKYPSSLWKLAGLDTVINEEGHGEGRSRKKHHLVESYYIDKNGEPQKKMGLSFNPFLKTKLVGVAGTCFLRSGGAYAEIYRGYKFRLQNDPRHAEKTDGHRHAMAVRYMLKFFLQDLYGHWRTMEGLPVSAPYAQAKLGIVHSTSSREAA